MGKKIRFDLLLITFVTLLAWYRFSDHPIDHESFLFYYYQGTPYGENWIMRDFMFWGYENNFARLLFYTLIQIFKDNIFLAVLPFFISILLVHTSYYLMVLQLSKQRIIALTSALILSTNVSGGFEMYEHGRYFFERVPQFFVLFPSFTLFSLFLSTKSKRYYLSSFCLFIIAVWMGHFSTLFLPAFILYTIFKSPRKVLFVVPFILVNYVIIRDSPLGPGFFRPGENLFSFLGDSRLFEQIKLQIVGVTYPRGVIRLFHQITKLPLTVIAEQLVIPTIIFYLTSVMYLFRNEKKLRALLLTCLAFVFISLIINVFFNRVDFKHEIEGSRYFWVAHTFLFTYFGILSYHFFTKHGNFVKTFLVAILVILIASNIYWIQKWEKEIRFKYIATNIVVNKVKDISNNLGNIKFIGIPSPMQVGPLSFLDLYYTKGRAKLIPSEELAFKVNEFSEDEVVILGYNQPIDLFEENSLKIIDEKENVKNLYQENGSLTEQQIYQILYK